MTAAIVGKVISYTVSRTTARPTWQTWLDDWKHARVSVKHDDDDGDDTSNTAAASSRDGKKDTNNGGLSPA
jgi:hypothetical protein